MIRLILLSCALVSTAEAFFLVPVFPLGAGSARLLVRGKGSSRSGVSMSAGGSMGQSNDNKVCGIRRGIIGGGVIIAAGALVGTPAIQEAGAAAGGGVEFSTISVDLPCAKILTGMWQLSGGHGFKPDKKAAVEAMKAQVEAGFTTFDLADHYGDGEQLPVTSTAPKPIQGFSPPILFCPHRLSRRIEGDEVLRS